MLEILQPLVNLLFRHTVHLSHEIEILLGGEEVDQETFVDIGAGIFLPLFAVDRIDGDFFANLAGLGRLCRKGYQHLPIVSFQQIEDQTEEGGLTRTIVSYKS